MQGRPDHRLLDNQHVYVRQDTDTATPRQQIPMYYMHSGTLPFCDTPRCFCQGGKRAGALLYKQLATGKLRLAQLAAVTTKISVDIQQGIPEGCQLYGHSWEDGDSPGAKKCSVCGVVGYCPYCIVLPPPDAQPFTCTKHAHRQVQP